MHSAKQVQLRSCQRQRARRGASVSAAAACGVAPGAVVRYLHAAALVLSRSLAALSCSRVSYSILKGECQEWFQWSQTLSPSARHARVALQLGVDRRVRPQLTTEKTACTGACAGPCTGCKGSILLLLLHDPQGTLLIQPAIYTNPAVNGRAFPTTADIYLARGPKPALPHPPSRWGEREPRL